MTSARAALERLCDPAVEVSAHYLIGHDGTLWQLVDEEQRAWHAGVGSWQEQDDINSRSIGIELDNDGAAPFSEPLMHRLETLLPGIMERWNIPPDGVIGHSDMAPGRKQDPGARFDWQRLARQGMAGQTPLGKEATGESLSALLVAAGYSAEVSAEEKLEAFRLRHRPTATGPADAQDYALLSALADKSSKICPP